MTKKASLKFLVLGLPIVAIAALVLVLTLGNGSSSKKAEAAGAAFTAHLSIGACNGPKCTVSIGSMYTVDVSIDKAASSFAGFQFSLTGVGNCKSADTNAKAGFSTHVSSCDAPGASPLALVAAAIGVGDSPQPATFTGKIGEAIFTCPAAATSGTVTVDPFPATGVVDAGGSPAAVVISNLNVNCVAPTSTSTPLPTATPPAIPRMQKCGLDPVTGLPTSGNNCLGLKGQEINLFLQDRNPSELCNDGESVLLVEGLSQAPVTTSKGETQTVGAFQFEVRYPKGVCLEFILPSDANFKTIGKPSQPPLTPGVVACQVFDEGKGLAKVGCVTVGKTQGIGTQLAGIIVHMAKDTVQAIKPNQENGTAFQIQDQGCQISDLQGVNVPIFSCEDAAISVRFLEGDVVPDCTVDVSDTQDIAFRWNAQTGSQLYQTFKDLSPSPQNGANGDGRIDIQDLQFVFGRFGSTCDTPHPPQPPFSDKTD